MLEVEALEARRGRRALFTDLAFTARPGQLVRVTGTNGAGKTTLLRMLVGLATPTQGQVRWRGALIAAQREEFHRQLVWCGHAASLKDDASAIENLRVAAALAGDAIEASAARQALGEAGLAGRDHLPARVLSAGQRRRVGLARLLLAAHRPLWVLDEPLNALDAAATQWLGALLLAHLARGGIVVLTSHQALALDDGAAQAVTVAL
ncbi:cytochrome c biogenesis heme-transporting ATPase CcmA [Aquabacterium sp. J223]|uniref:cytochrome c biogenesis heme-transporting ATPase CcmA n=1 Tax=Aquabacterium sp. J223 TaxID=2898431 RepID=UPI0021AE01F3|nr:cytochrome c biogenesis heme-transporting ATPase CcmA [Aquabacterium sp. J223]UUX96637.1 cytochrome c biogenesis heme-transporting ATPase CcmA [Aquabacterium sp. J223]